MTLKQIPLGTRFGRLVTTSEVFVDALPSGQTLGHVRCNCDCGTTDFKVNASSLRRRTRPTISCGCAHMTNLPVGTRFGRQVTVGWPYAQPREDGPNEVLVEVACDCGTMPRPVLVKSLINGNSQSCGCLHRDRVSTVGGLTRQHRALYKCWTNMRHRCMNPANVNYKYYGGKGIQVSQAWRDNFPGFVAWALSAAYEDGLELDRIDPDSNYEPDNCRWITRRENIQRAGRLLDDPDEERLAFYMRRTGKTLQDVIEEALDRYLPTSPSSDLRLAN